MLQRIMIQQGIFNFILGLKSIDNEHIRKADTGVEEQGHIYLGVKEVPIKGAGV